MEREKGLQQRYSELQQIVEEIKTQIAASQQLEEIQEMAHEEIQEIPVGQLIESNQEGVNAENSDHYVDSGNIFES